MHPSKFREMEIGPGDAAPPLLSSLNPNPIQSATAGQRERERERGKKEKPNFAPRKARS
jgi:hypothetical protein